MRIPVVITKEIVENSGVFDDCFNCPLSVAVRLATGIDFVSVGVETVTIGGEDFKLTQPFLCQEYGKIKRTGYPFKTEIIVV